MMEIIRSETTESIQGVKYDTRCVKLSQVNRININLNVIFDY